MGISEREALEDHFRSYNEGHADGYREGYNDGWEEGAKSGRPRPHRLIRGKGPTQALRGNGPSAVKKKRRKTAYQSAYSAAYKRLKKTHPRMAFGSLSKKAHAAARKKVK